MDQDSLLAELGKNIRYFRRMLNLSQEELAEKAGLTQNYISSLEKGRQNVKILTLLKISDSLHVKIRDLIE